MGCLVELIFEIIIEGTIELVGHCYIKLMQLIVPNKSVTENTKKVIKNTVTTVAALLLVVLVVGVIFLFGPDPSLAKIGRYLTYIPLSIILLQITLGIILKIISLFRK